MAKHASHPRCTVCSHPDRHLIESEVVAGLSRRAIAVKHGLGLRALFRHMRNHVSQDERAAYIADVPLAELAERAAAEGVSLLDYLAITRKTLVHAMLTAHSMGDMAGIARLGGKMIEMLRLQGELTGDLSRAVVDIRNSTTTVTNTAVFVNSPLFAKMQRMLIERLAPFPGALAAVTDGFAELDREETDALSPPAGAPPRRPERGGINAA